MHLPNHDIGRHLQADLFGITPERLRGEDALVSMLGSALAKAGFHVLRRDSHAFPGPGGVTAVFMLTESHLAIHTYPEHGYAALDLFSCGAARPEDVLEALTSGLGATRVERVLTPRGRGLLEPAAVLPTPVTT
ncbi:MAG: adenosylmethionine decarboxylase [Acidobacteriota bacterium]